MHFVSGTELRTYKRTDEQTDDPITRCPRQTFQAGGIKMVMLQDKIQASKFLHRADSLSLTKHKKTGGGFEVAFTIFQS